MFKAWCGRLSSSTSPFSPVPRERKLNHASSILNERWSARQLGVVAISLWAAGLVARQRAAATMAAAATAYVNSLTPEQKPEGVFPMPDKACLDAETSTCEWTKWAFIPASMSPRNGVSLKDMTPAQRQRAHNLMKASMSQAGYTTATTIMSSSW